MTNKNPFGNFSGTSVGEAEQVKWEYPGIGYNASSGTFYVGEEQVDGLTIVPLAMRQCKEVEDVNGTIHRYPVYTQKSKMIASDEVSYRLQVVGIVNGELHVFGARSWTARASWLNPRSGQYRAEMFDTGIWYKLDDWIKAKKGEHGVSTTPLCWELTLKVGAGVTVGTGKNTAQSKPVVMAAEPVFVGADRVAEYEALYVDEDLAGWVAEWKKTTTETAVSEKPAVIEADELPEGIPF